jgi:hypothetical protein
MYQARSIQSGRFHKRTIEKHKQKRGLEQKRERATKKAKRANERATTERQQSDTLATALSTSGLSLCFDGCRSFKPKLRPIPRALVVRGPTTETHTHSPEKFLGGG